MRTLPALFTLLLALPAAAHASAGDGAFERRCERELRPQLEVRVRPPTFSLNNTVSSLVLNTRHSYASVDQRLLGMTAGTTRTEILTDAPSLADGERECLGPRILIELTYQPLDVFVAREFSLYSCGYRAVYEHEMRHVAIYRDALPQLQARLEQVLRERFGNRPLYAARGEGLAQLDAYVDGWLRPFIRAELAKVEQQQRDLDSQEEVYRLSHACAGEVAATMGSSF